MDFFKKYKKIILNGLVVIAVLLAVYSKWTESGSEAFFKETDVYIYAGIVIGFLVLNLFNKFNNRKR